MQHIQCVCSKRHMQQLNGADLLAYATADTKSNSDTITLPRYSTHRDLIAAVVIWSMYCKLERLVSKHCIT